MNRKYFQRSQWTASIVKPLLRVVTAIILAITFTVVGCFPLANQGIALAETQKAATSSPAKKRPNILVIMGDDIGWFNISAYNRGMMGTETPNIDRIAKKGILFTDAYGEQSCTAGRAAFITGQSPARTGLTKVGLPGVNVGPSGKDPTLAELLKPRGYVTGQFGKNHLGDLNKYLPTNHGFDEFYGNLYHLNAEEEPENPDYPKDQNFKNKFGPRGVLHSFDLSNGGKNCSHIKIYAVNPKEIKDESNPYNKDDENTQNQRVCNTGSLDTERMKTVDQEFLDASIDFIDKANKDQKPFFVWFNSTRTHIFTHLPKKYDGITKQGIYADGLKQHDDQVGVLLDHLKNLGIDKNTIVIYTTDNGAEVFSWPDGGTTPFRSEKNSNWEGGFRVPTLIRWTGHIPDGVVSNEIISNQDWVPTLMAVAGVPDIKEQLLTSYQAGNKTFEKIHLDGYNLLPYLENPDTEKSPRHEFIYLTDDAYPSALRFDDWKFIFSEMRADGFQVWAEPYVDLRLPLIINLRRDPFEKAPEESAYYTDWRLRHTFLVAPAQTIVGKFIDTFKEYPPRQKPASFSINNMLKDFKDFMSKQKKLDTINDAVQGIGETTTLPGKP